MRGKEEKKKNSTIKNIEFDQVELNQLKNLLEKFYGEKIKMLGEKEQSLFVFQKTINSNSN